MALFFPSFENIQRLTTPPTAGELFFLSQLAEHLDDAHEVFFNPFLDGDRPDVIVLKKNCGAAIIEVKDWNLVHYRIDTNNKWHYGDAQKIAPQQQAYRGQRGFSTRLAPARAGPRQRPSSPPPLQAASSQQGSYPSYT